MHKTGIIKKVVTIGFALVLSLLSVTGYGKEAKADMMVRAIQVRQIYPSLSLGNGTATCGVNVRAEAGVSRIEGSLTLQKVEGNATSTVGSWDVSTASRILNTVKTTSVKKGTYKLVVCVKLHKGNETETVVRSVTASY